MANKYVQCVHTAAITCKNDGKDADGSFEKIFHPAMTDRYTGRIIHTGYTAITEDEFARLKKESPLFNVALNKWKKLVLHDDLPAEAKTPHEALVDARKDVQAANQKLEEVLAENEKLKAELDEANKKYGELLAAGSIKEGKK
jgi:hypothetical protein